MKLSVRTSFPRLCAGLLTGLFALTVTATVQAEEPAATTSEAGQPQASPEPQAPPEPRLKVKRADRREGPPTAMSLARNGCLSDPEQCRCSHKDPNKSAICAQAIGHFCPDSTLKYMASKCLSLFGGVTVCKCAARSEIQTYISNEESAAKKKSKKKSKGKTKSKKKSSGKKKK